MGVLLDKVWALSMALVNSTPIVLKGKAKGPPSRTPEEVLEHYRIECELADRLRRAGREERLLLYPSLNDELFRRVPTHPLLTLKASPQDRARGVSKEMRLLRPLLSPGCVFLEVGPGDCALSIAVSAVAGRVYAVDVSQEITRAEAFPENLRLIISDGCSVPVPPGTVDVAYSNQLMEHLHPDDAREQLRNIHASLKPGGCYLCITPNRLSGPHDVSVYFDDVARGFHLKEYTNSELAALFRECGFSRVRVVLNAKLVRPRLPPAVFRAAEGILARLPRGVLPRSRPVLRYLLGAKVIGWK